MLVLQVLSYSRRE